MLGVSSILLVSSLHLYIWSHFIIMGVFILRVITDVSYMFSHIFIVWMLIMIWYGWKIACKTVDEKDMYCISMLLVIMICMMTRWGYTFWLKKIYLKSISPPHPYIIKILYIENLKQNNIYFLLLIFMLISHFSK